MPKRKRTPKSEKSGSRFRSHSKSSCFLHWLHLMLSDKSNSHAVSWVVPLKNELICEGGGVKDVGKIVVHDIALLKDSILREYFEKSTFSHFEKMLLELGFRKHYHCNHKNTATKTNSCSFVHTKLGKSLQSLLDQSKNENSQREAQLTSAESASVYASTNQKAPGIKEDLCVGDVVFACWLKGVRKRWYLGRVKSLKVVGETEYGQVRRYSILFDDGDKDDNLDEIWVWGEDSYLLETAIEDKKRKIFGVTHCFDSNSNDEYAKERGWYVTDLTNDFKFATVAKAMEVYDNLYVRRNGKRACPSKMNFPNKWTFFPDSVPIYNSNCLRSDERPEIRSLEKQEGFDELGSTETELGWLLVESTYVSPNRQYDWSYVEKNASKQLSTIIKLTKELSPDNFQNPLFYLSAANEEIFGKFCKAVSKTLAGGYRRQKSIQNL
mmetsp:Transcript_3245/g.5908  ORF Transcript_3245/g.5908 Transcript_3245/m.5908 type:complete len:438 (+) Transcript_3245:59-1372(+)